MRNNGALASIIVSNYNYARFVGDAIRSALRQTYDNLEVVVVDDGSTDDSRDVIAGFGDRIRTAWLQHSGQCACLNEGVRISTGRFVLFLDADDCLLEDAIARLVQPCLETDGISQSQGYLLAVDAELNSLDRTIPERLSPTGDYRAATLRCGLGVCRQTYTSGSLWPRGVVDKLFPLPELSATADGGYLGPDGYLNNAARLLGRIVSLPEPVAYYRVHGGNSWHGAGTFDPRWIQAHLSTVEFYQDYLYRFSRQLGYSPDLARWRKWKQSWVDNLAGLALNLMDNFRGRPGFDEVVLAPFMCGTTGRVKAVFVALMLAFVWLGPRPFALTVAKRVLRRKLPSLAVGAP